MVCIHSLILITTLWSRYYYNPYSLDEGKESWVNSPMSTPSKCKRWNSNQSIYFQCLESCYYEILLFFSRRKTLVVSRNKTISWWPHLLWREVCKIWPPKDTFRAFSVIICHQKHSNTIGTWTCTLLEVNWQIKDPES